MPDDTTEQTSPNKVIVLHSRAAEAPSFFQTMMDFQHGTGETYERAAEALTGSLQVPGGPQGVACPLDQLSLLLPAREEAPPDAQATDDNAPPFTLYTGSDAESTYAVRLLRQVKVNFIVKPSESWPWSAGQTWFLPVLVGDQRKDEFWPSLKHIKNYLRHLLTTHTFQTGESISLYPVSDDIHNRMRQTWQEGIHSHVHGVMCFNEHGR